MSLSAPPSIRPGRGMVIEISRDLIKEGGVIPLLLSSFLIEP